MGRRRRPGPSQEIAPPRAGAADDRIEAAKAALTVDPAGAEAILRALLLAAPDHAAAHLLLGQALAALDRLPEAVAALDRAVALDPRRDDALRVLARLALKMGDDALIGRVSDQLLRDFGQEPRALDLAAKGYRKLRRHAETVEALRRLAELKPDLDEPLLRLAQAQAAAGEGEAALATVIDILLHAPDDAAAAEVLPSILARLDNPDALDAAGRRVAAVAPAAATRIAATLLDLGQPDRAAGVVACIPEDARDAALTARVVELLAHTMRVSGRVGDAEGEARAALALRRFRPEHAGAAAVLRRTGTALRDAARALPPEEAVRAADLLRQAHTHMPERTSLLEDAARGLERAGEWGRAVEFWTLAHAAGAGPDALRRAGRVAEKAGDPDAMLAAWQAVAADAPGDAEAARQCDRALDRLTRAMREDVAAGREDDALRRARTALAAEPDNRRAAQVIRDLTRARVTALRAALKADDADAAEACARALLDVDAESPDALLALARRSEARRNQAEAAAWYARLAAVSPDDVKAALKLAKLHRNLRNPAEAARWARRVLELNPDNAEAQSIAGMVAEAA